MLINEKVLIILLNNIDIQKQKVLIILLNSVDIKNNCSYYFTK